MKDKQIEQPSEPAPSTSDVQQQQPGWDCLGDIYEPERKVTQPLTDVYATQVEE